MTQLSKNRYELTVGELSERSGVPASALRFYERQGLIRSRRTSGNQRRFARDTLRRVAFVRVSQRVGIPLATIRDVLGLLPEERTPDRDDWAQVSQCWQEDLNARIRQLEKLRDHLTDCIGCGCLSIDRCALANPYDQLGAEGNGPRRLLTDEPEQTAASAGGSAAGGSAGGARGRRAAPRRTVAAEQSAGARTATVPVAAVQEYECCTGCDDAV
ncbi:redox-sensitive transcriptional activator SoxR [Streptomyces sp. AC563]|uniref:redox-sensitive transcriptional activator SoxR n=1 Tax=Streptomyces buecherae TaxID=2763006 RepID=UPI00164DC055|nr:redox-sensitive transcriptional activator SoxR [Streptomyces buecherae]MBC3981395.1 redox-sensitive transcriptional activator SoxR [Streptomyces buecherae]MBC3993440.1 redox-sensitive transcriptional activator SoxR [Streptomyces buecherae]QNJ41681.1 redox-sensitive transcriptional activator SoxR [Streptomyces buecherae]